jgi:hypothetical protein
MSGRNFDEVLKGTEKIEWEAFKLVPDKLLSICKTPNCSELFEEMLGTCRTMGCNMTLEIHFLHYHLHIFRQNLVYFNGEDQEMFLHDISNVEKCYQGNGI